MPANSTFENTEILFEPPNNMVIFTNGDEKLRLDSDGHFGLGTNSPITARLKIQAEDSSDDKYALRVTNVEGTNSFFAVRNDGQIEMNIGNFNIPKGKLTFNANTREGTAGIADTDSGSIYGEHDENTEVSRLVIDIADNVNDSIVLRTSATSGGSVVDMVKVSYNNVALAPVSGKVGIGTNNINSNAKLEVTGGNVNIPADKLTFNAGITAGIAGIASSDSGSIYGEHDENTEISRLVLHITDNIDDAIVLRTSEYSSGLTIDMVKIFHNKVLLAPESGKVGIGTTAPSDKLDVSGNINYDGQLTKLDVADKFTATIRAADLRLGHSTRRINPGRALVDYTDTLLINCGGDWTGGVRYYVSMVLASSRELKENIANLTLNEASQILESLNSVKFNLKADNKKTPHLGFIAEDAPELIASPDRKAINNDHIVAVLTKIVKEQQKEILTLRNKVRLLEETYERTTKTTS